MTLLKPGQLNLRLKTVPGGSHWTCQGCYRLLQPGDRVYGTGHKRYCSICKEKIKPPNPPKLRVKRRPSSGMLRSHQGD